MTTPTVGARTLSEVRIIEAAAALLVADGADAFSMRRLATRLGVTPMALYRWFDNREALLDAVVDAMMTDLQTDVSGEGEWEDRVFALVAAVRRHLLQHRQLLAIPSASNRLTATMYRTATPGLDLMAEIGLEDADAVAAYRCVFWHAVSFASVTDQWVQGAGLARLDPDATPLPSDQSGHFTTFDADALFEQSTRALIRGLRA